MNGVKGPTKQKPASAESELTSGQAQAGNHEAATTSEVGIKLDLARQFLDMGDPDSARHILDEVLHEGDASQRQQAKRLIDTLP